MEQDTVTDTQMPERTRRKSEGSYPAKTPLSRRAQAKSPAFCSVALEPMFEALQRTAGIRPIS